MGTDRRPWRDELAIIDRTLRAISGITDPEQLVDVYWANIGELVHYDHYLALSRRDVDPPAYLVTRSSRFAEDLNPWTQRERLPRLSGGLLGEILYGDQPAIIDDLPARLAPDDPGRFYLDGFQSLIALPQYEDGLSINVSVMLFPAGEAMDPRLIPMMHWAAGLFGRGTTNLVAAEPVDDRRRGPEPRTASGGRHPAVAAARRVAGHPRVRVGRVLHHQRPGRGRLLRLLPAAQRVLGIARGRRGRPRHGRGGPDGHLPRDRPQPAGGRTPRRRRCWRA